MPISLPRPDLAEARAFLASARLFQDMAETTVEEILDHFEWLLVPGGSVVCLQGEPGDGLYLVASGRLVVVRENEHGEEVLLNQVRRGESVGELSVLTGRPRTVTVRAVRDSTVAWLSRERTEALLRRHPEALLALTRRLTGWLEAQPKGQRRGSVSVAVVAAGEVPLAEMSALLATSLSAMGPTQRLSPERIGSRFGLDAAAIQDGSREHGRMASWLEEQEAGHAFVVYEAGTSPSRWASRCLRQADRILLLAWADAEPSLGSLGSELAFLGGAPRVELVLLHREADRRPRGTARWLALHPFVRHHHLRLGVPSDFDRLARFLGGTAVGLVLGGGGARGFAHIGVLRALAEAGVPIDRVGGTSMGAMIAAQWARGHSWEEIRDLQRQGWIEMRPHRLFTLPLVSVLSARRCEEMLFLMYRDQQIEDLWLDFFCVATNLTRAELVVYRSGKVHRCVGTGMRIPGIVPPVVKDGDLLVDGGVLNNLPVDVMRRLGEGPVVAVDVSASVDLRADGYRKAPTPWRLLARRFNRLSRRPRFPNIARIVQRSAMLASDVYAKQAKREVELYLDLPVEGFDLFDVDVLDELVELGYSFAKEKLAETPWQPEGMRRVLVV